MLHPVLVCSDIDMVRRKAFGIAAAIQIDDLVGYNLEGGWMTRCSARRLLGWQKIERGGFRLNRPGSLDRMTV